jgi:hypothetical protein
MASKLFLYSFFHANLQFSSIPSFQYPAIIEKCYWPVLKMLDKYDIALGLEFPAYTLEKIQSLDKYFIIELKKLAKAGKCEVIGSGYSQNIMPLIPAEVNMKNLNLGTAVYKKLLGFKPSILYLNEQVYSKGLVKMINKAGYDATVLDWDNAAEYGNLPSEHRYSPHLLKGTDDQKTKLIWNSSIAFQKFQRYIKNEITLEEVKDGRQDIPLLRLRLGDIQLFARKLRYHVQATGLPEGLEAPGRIFREAPRLQGYRGRHPVKGPRNYKTR